MIAQSFKQTLNVTLASLTLAVSTLSPSAHAQGTLPTGSSSGSGLALATTNLPTELRPGMLAPSDPRAQLDPTLLQLPAVKAPDTFGNAPAAAMAPVEMHGDLTTGQIGVRAAGAVPVDGGAVSKKKAGAFSPSFAGEGVQAQKVQGTDDRTWVSNTWEYPWRTQCKLIITFPSGNQFIGSGTMVGHKYVLTAGHCAYDAAQGGLARSIEVIPGLSGTYKPYGSFWSTYARWTYNGDAQHDMALLTLNANAGSTVGWLGYAHYPTVWGTIGNLAGYPGDLYGGIWQYFHSGATYDGLLWGRPGQIVHWIDTFGGQSGSGIYKLENGHRYIYAVHGGGVPGLNRGAKITGDKFDWIARSMASGY